MIAAVALAILAASPASFPVPPPEPCESWSSAGLESLARICPLVRSYYAEYDSAAARPDFAEADRESAASDLASELADLKPFLFNNALLLLESEHFRYSSRRPAIALLLAQLHRQVERELEDERSRTRASILTESVLSAIVIVGSLETARGWWRTARAGGTFVELIEDFVASVRARNPNTWQKALGISALGIGLADLRLAYESMRVRKLDPDAVLKDAREHVARDLGRRAKEALLTLRGIEETEIGRARWEAARSSLRELGAEIGESASELAELKQDAPELKHWTSGIEQDLGDAAVGSCRDLVAMENRELEDALGKRRPSPPEAALDKCEEKRNGLFSRAEEPVQSSKLP